MADLQIPRQLPTVPELLAAMDIRSEPVYSDSFGAPDVHIPEPLGWQRLGREVFPGTYGVWIRDDVGDREWSDNAVIMVGRLSTQIDAAAILRCSPTECRRMPRWRETNVNTGACSGFPAVGVSGSYATSRMVFWVHSRYIVVQTKREQYLIQLTVTIRTDTAASIADGETIAAGLEVRNMVPESSAHRQGATSIVDVAQAGPQLVIGRADGVAVTLDQQGNVQSVDITPSAYALGADRLSELVTALYQQTRARAVLPAFPSQQAPMNPGQPNPTSPQPAYEATRWRAPSSDDQWPKSQQSGTTDQKLWATPQSFGPSPQPNPATPQPPQPPRESDSSTIDAMDEYFARQYQQNWGH